MNEKQKLGQEPAFGFSAYTDPKEGQGQNLTHSKREGMSKRFYAACAAMQGILAGRSTHMSLSTIGESLVIEYAYKFADELLRQENL